MTKTIVQFSILLVILIISQVMVFNNICLFNYAVPFVFIYSILRLPITLSTNWVLTFSFIAGLCVDIFANTPGMNALACTLSAMSRRTILHLYFPSEDELSIPEPSIRSLGFDVYAKYLFTMVFLYCCYIFIIEACSFFDILRLILRIVSSTILTFLLLLGLDSILSRHD